MLYDSSNHGPRTKVHDGLLYFSDSTRNRWLSVSRSNAMYGLDSKGINCNCWLKMSGNNYSLSSGYKMIRNSMITGISIQTKEDARCDFHLMKNGDPSIIHSVGLNLQHDLIEDNLSIDIDRGDWIQIKLVVNALTVSYPEVFIEYCWRI